MRVPIERVCKMCGVVYENASPHSVYCSKACRCSYETQYALKWRNEHREKYRAYQRAYQKKYYAKMTGD